LSDFLSRLGNFAYNRSIRQSGLSRIGQEPWRNSFIALQCWQMENYQHFINYHKHWISHSKLFIANILCSMSSIYVWLDSSSSTCPFSWSSLCYLTIRHTDTINPNNLI
jgi:hypothetical protein